MTTVFWVLMPICIALGSALLAVYIMQQRLEMQLARERQSLSEARALIEAHKDHLDELNKLREESASRKSFDGFREHLQIEQRHQIQEPSPSFAGRKVLVLQERISFGEIPLSNWVQHELPVESSEDIDNLAKTLSVFASDLPVSVFATPQKIPAKKPVKELHETVAVIRNQPAGDTQPRKIGVLTAESVVGDNASESSLL